MGKQTDVLVIGAGLAGLTAAWQVAMQGKKVKVLAKGWGATHWHSGCIDLLGYWPLDADTAVAHPAQAIEQLIKEQPQHPYALAGLDNITAALSAFQELCAVAGYPLEGSPEKNWLLPTAVGTFRPTCLAPQTMTAGDLSDDAPMLLVGFAQFVDFYPRLAADNLTQQGVPAAHVTLDLPSLAQQRRLTSVVLAHMMEQETFRQEVAQALKPKLGQAARVGFPAVLGLQEAAAVWQAMSDLLERPVFEIPTLPPSVAGIRLHHILKNAIQAQGGWVFDGMEAVGAEKDGGRVTAVLTETAARNRAHRAQNYVLSTGGILGGGIYASYKGGVQEVVFDLPVNAPDNHLDWFYTDFMDKRGHPIYQTGISVNEQFQPVNGSEQPLLSNLFAAGATLAHCEPVRERSFEGIALATGYVVGSRVVGSRTND
ncbi:MAG TPA: glycerol-3-phosphate dehydrogenase subunit GlpB [Anaerolineae bacterium]|nr:glycerol-3-phosphate dehydrogenase subunit GlpB [Anaerolineae bacterium]